MAEPAQLATPLRRHSRHAYGQLSVQLSHSPENHWVAGRIILRLHKPARDIGRECEAIQPLPPLTSRTASARGSRSL